MASVFTVAQYILEKRADKGHQTTTFALQKLLYFCKGWSLAAANDPLFEDAISAWGHGPVVDALWPFCRGKRYIRKDEVPDIDHTNDLDSIQKSRIDRVLQSFEEIDDSKLGDVLEELSHQQTPWKEARVSASSIISNDSIKDYFAQLEIDPPEEQKRYLPELTDISTQTFISDEDMEWLEKTFA